MGSRQNRTCSTLHHFAISFLILLVLGSSHLRFNAQGTIWFPVNFFRCPKTELLTYSFVLFGISVAGRPIAKSIGNSKIGSKPPRCEGKCNTCGHCEAIQVPTNPQIKDGHKNSRNSSLVSTVSYSRGDDYSNYKPMSWKCKCGDLIFNP